MQQENEPQQTGTTEPKGVTVIPSSKKGVTIIDKNSKTTPPPVEISEGEGDRD